MQVGIVGFFRGDILKFERVAIEAIGFTLPPEVVTSANIETSLGLRKAEIARGSASSDEWNR